MSAAARIPYTVSGADELPPGLDAILAIVHPFSATTVSGWRRPDEQVAAIGARSAGRPAVFHLIYRSAARSPPAPQDQLTGYRGPAAVHGHAASANSPIRTH